LLAIEKRLAANIERTNLRLFLWASELARIGQSPMRAHPWLSDALAGNLYQAYGEAFRLGWTEADEEVRRAYLGRTLAARAVNFPATVPFADVPPETPDYAEKFGSLLIEIGASRILIHGQMQQDGSWNYPAPEEGLRWYLTQALKLAHESDAAKLKAAQLVIHQGVLHGQTYEEMIGGLAEVLRPYGLPGGLGAEPSPPGVTKALRDVGAYPHYRLENIVRTESMYIYNAGRYIRQAASDLITGWMDSEILDDRICEDCEERHGVFVTKEEAIGNWPPYHWMCRGIMIPVWEFEEQPTRRLADLPAGKGLVAKGFGDPLRREWAA
jgi:SPP1 gp7 family putative phage head morphogenesis protein